jgi:hypothetical protein
MDRLAVQITVDNNVIHSGVTIKRHTPIYVTVNIGGNVTVNGGIGSDDDLEIHNLLLSGSLSMNDPSKSPFAKKDHTHSTTDIDGYDHVDILGYEDDRSPSDENVMSALRTINEILQRSISKTNPDTAAKVITFIEGLKSLSPIEVGEVIDSMLAGRGTLITPDKIQTPRLEVRGQAVFMELIINRLSAMEGDTSFSDSGTIESVTQVAELTYKLQMRRRWETDFTSFDVGDVVYGIVNDLFNGNYYKVWFLVQARDLGSNELIVVQYTDNMVPGGVNYPPTDGMVVARRGNTTNEDRQSCWYISTTEGAIMYLTGVTKPILEESNYSLILGRPKQLELFNGLPLNYNNPYLYARGAIIQDLFRIDYQGNPSYEDIDCGLWDSNRQYINGYNDVSKRYVREGVWHESSYWRCTAAQSTIGVPPRFNNTEWTCLVGDKNYTIEILNPDKLVRVTAVAATLSVVVRHGTMDITSDVVLWEWTRSSGLPAEDNLWAIERKASESVLAITNADMASNWLDTRKVSFRVQATIIPGVAPLTAEYSIN